jgi:two-component system, chemotaxis family, CheB/CheR fusion protein
MFKLQEELERSREEIQTANEELQSSNEELETTNEELQSSNEELETTNEELQSTNEELETMNEELQSSNEEMQTVNDELHQRTDELNSLNAFLKSVLASIDSGAVVVNPDFNIMMWNHKAEDMWGLRSDEVEGKSLLNLDIGLPVEKLRILVRACLTGGDGHGDGDGAVVLDATNRRGKPIKCRVTCSPLVAGKRGTRGAIILMAEEAV